MSCSPTSAWRRQPENPGLPAIERISVLLIGPAGGDQIQVLTALGGAATAAYAETADSAIERLRRDNLDVALVTTGHDHHELQRLCATVRSDAELFDLPVLLVARSQHFADPTQPFAWGVSDVLFQPFHPEVLRLRVQAWVRQQRLRRHLRGGLGSLAPTNDRLTRLYGHGFLHAYVDHLIEESARTGGTLALVGLTVARMGQINQLYGYAAGDRVLATLGGVLASSSRAEDLPARLRGRPLLPGAQQRDRARRPRRRRALRHSAQPYPDRARRAGGTSRSRSRPASPSWPRATTPRG